MQVAAAANDSSEGETADTGDGTGRRRRGRRGGRRRRRGAGETGTSNESSGSEDFGDDEQPQVIIANGSQPEFDFDDETPAARPPAAQAPAAPAVAALAVAAPVAEQVRPAPEAVTPESVAVAPAAVETKPAAVVETPQPAATAPSVEWRTESVAAQTESLAITTPAEANATAQEILKNDTVESFTLVENPAPAEAASIVAQAAEPETTLEEVVHEVVEPTPAPVAAVEPPKPAPVRPAVGNTGSLFFTADADTPSSVTRHLFEPMPAPQPAAVVEKHEEHDLPLLAENDEAASEEEKDQGSERSA